MNKNEKFHLPLISSFRIYICVESPDIQKAFFNALQPFGYKLFSFDNGKEAFESITENLPDLIIASFKLKEMSGVELLQNLKRDLKTLNIPFMVVLSKADKEDTSRAFKIGAEDVIRFPFYEDELRGRVRSLLKIKTSQQRLENEKKLLEIRLKEKINEIHEITLGLVAALEMTTEMNDIDARGHIKRVSIYSEIIAKEMGLHANLVQKIGLFAPMHDVGKIGIPDSILKKQGILDKREFEIMKKHTVYGYQILLVAKLDEVAQNIALYHHEREDGSGYPYGIKGDMIPVEAKIVGFVDVFDAVTTMRCYKDAISLKEAKELLLIDQKHLFAPQILQSFIKRETQFKYVLEEFL